MAIVNMRNRMGRPCLKRRVNFNPQVRFFKPQGIPMSGLEVVELKKEELEAVRLKYVKDLDQKECSMRMNTSPATLQRILASANRKIALALVTGKAIKIAGN